MPSTASHSFDTGQTRAERLDALGHDGRLEHYERGELSMADLSLWAARYPDEAPLVNGEFAWISLTLADLD
jgi:hypothetical protein